MKIDRCRTSSDHREVNPCQVQIRSQVLKETQAKVILMRLAHLLSSGACPLRHVFRPSPIPAPNLVFVALKRHIEGTRGHNLRVYKLVLQQRCHLLKYVQLRLLARREENLLAGRLQADRVREGVVEVVHFLVQGVQEVQEGREDGRLEQEEGVVLGVGGQEGQGGGPQTRLEVAAGLQQEGVVLDQEEVFSEVLLALFQVTIRVRLEGLRTLDR